MKTIEEINKKIKEGSAVVITADKMTQLVSEIGVEEAAKEVDVVTTGTFGAMCSSGAFLNFGHTDPPIKMSKTLLNGVEAYSGLAAVDAYIGAAQINSDPTIGLDYGGSHVIEDLIRGKDISLHAEAYGTDCYPLKNVDTSINIESLNQATMMNPRNAYQSYGVATNSRDETIHTYMGTLLPNNQNITYSSAGELSPLLNDPYFQTIGMGTKIFLCGAEGYVVSEGTQHFTDGERKNGVVLGGAGTLTVTGNMKEMNSDFVRGVTMPEYGPTLYVGLGIPIPILNEDIAARTAIADKDITTKIFDYGIPSSKRPVLREVTYAELKTGHIDLNGEEIPVSPLSSYKKALEVAHELQRRIEEGEFLLTQHVKKIPSEGYTNNPLEIKEKVIYVRDLVSKSFIVASPDEDIHEVASKMVENAINHIPIVDEYMKIIGIITSWDVAKALANKKNKLSDVMTSRVITTNFNDPLESALYKFDKFNISGIPVVDDNNIVRGLLTAEDVLRNK